MDGLQWKTPILGNQRVYPIIIYNHPIQIPLTIDIWGFP